jgi:hypothetical protein
MNPPYAAAASILAEYGLESWIYAKEPACYLLTGKLNSAGMNDAWN